MILQGDPNDVHVFVHESKDGFVRIGMGVAPNDNLVEITFTPVAEERLWRMLNLRREAWQGQDAKA